MLATTMTKRLPIQEAGRSAALATYLPSPLLLQLVIENGWKVVRTELVPSEDQTGLVYLVTFKSKTSLQNHQMILPRTPLIQKILDEHSCMDNAVN